MHTFTNYEDWKLAITQKCGLHLTEAYCTERAAALRNLKDEKTQSFLTTYGEEYYKQVIAWFEKALNEAKSSQS
ncbi:hypothetical protein JIN85_15135 [Luteolibacter pohnpeiensis]|uniref:Uncharacterized protein n=1 Tax=Luteolibacter pohnpeiensis TaxID=454153 RepID=A0A934S6W1_9BACT|nr:hypothetical protein [Luteolibacter pohnpeiensis]MBK1883751.1 hypothetical protein [Luteolibacter pohnpeiensis]